MTNYKLIYFNGQGLAEPIRYTLSYAGAKCDDVRINTEQWSKIKPDMPMGHLPVLKLDGKKYHQSKAILRFLGKKFNLYGTNDEEAFKIDASTDDIEDLRLAMSRYHWEKYEAPKEKLKIVAFEKLSSYMDKFNARVKENGGHFVNGKMSFADLMYAGSCDFLSMVIGHPLNKDHPELQKLVDKVEAEPKIKAYIAQRPKTDF